MQSCSIVLKILYAGRNKLPEQLDEKLEFIKESTKTVTDRKISSFLQHQFKT